MPRRKKTTKIITLPHDNEDPSKYRDDTVMKDDDSVDDSKKTTSQKKTTTSTSQKKTKSTSQKKTTTTSTSQKKDLKPIMIDGKPAKWRTLKHNGPIFPPAYEPHGVAILYNGKPLELTPFQEEYATYFARYAKTQHMDKPQFSKNFFADWRTYCLNGTKNGKIIKSLKRCDFTPIITHLEAQKELRAARTKEEKKAEKEAREELRKVYGVATINGAEERVGNYQIEPPGLFLGRGNHPKAGQFKLRVLPNEVTINIGKEVPDKEIPKPPALSKIIGVCKKTIDAKKLFYKKQKKQHLFDETNVQAWREVRNDQTVTWLAFWNENVLGGYKYVWLHASSSLKGKSDQKKFDIARQLSKVISAIRAKNRKALADSSALTRQRATALWLIDNLALRVGNEKGSDLADTVGCTSLRKEHISFPKESDAPPEASLKKMRPVRLKFLGKDSMLYDNVFGAPPRVYKNLKAFCAKKKAGQDLFDQLNSTKLNAYLRQQMKGLSVKVFRTFNASLTLEQELDKVVFDDDTTVAEKVLAFNKANKTVAELCNHQRSVPKSHETQMEKLTTEIEQLKAKCKELKVYLKKYLKKDKSPPQGAFIYWKDRSESDEAASSSSQSQALSPNDDTAEPQKLIKRTNYPTNIERAEKKIDWINNRIHLREVKKAEKTALKTVALGTSKINYIDPRIVVRWCKINQVPIAKVFAKTLREKFDWAINTENIELYRFDLSKAASTSTAAASSTTTTKRKRKQTTTTNNKKSKKQKN